MALNKISELYFTGIMHFYEKTIFLQLKFMMRNLPSWSGHRVSVPVPGGAARPHGNGARRTWHSAGTGEAPHQCHSHDSCAPPSSLFAVEKMFR